ncbi:MAG: hydroxymethylglutaryl-CoA reductase, degradative [Zestosphaera tikiterensis]|uniref:3-hydroxy-3-methylglutaryl coenzyme A reductase n=1 Tax=Zestosphaera tikiterensis TaxID=1973259 RepID=A0A2R7Y4M6_9CREN|nr:MAG: hydroxymethylglutaryl-CoA reductase, degradative [Zestosphaera tikiterensis]
MLDRCLKTIGTSRLPGFHKLSMKERLLKLKEIAQLSEEDIQLLSREGPLPLEIADKMIENVVGTFALPFAIATNFLINDKDYLIPMVIEEPSVVAAASNAARMTREGGGIRAQATDSIMISQIQLVKVPSPYTAKYVILERKQEIMDLANSTNPILTKVGGGVRDVEVNVLDSPVGPMVITNLVVDVKDAMGANTVNTMAEAVAPLIEKWTGGKVYLRIISNLADRRLVRAWTRVPKDVLGGEEVVDGIVYAWAFAAADPYRAATHNKGIMNGVIAVALATGQDTRALEAGAHAYASRSGKYSPLSVWEKDGNGDLVGYLEMPMAVGVIGGAVKVNPMAQLSLKILGVKTAKELAEVMGAVGLAQNLAALRALATEGIQRGHMKLHARQLAITAGAAGKEVDVVVEEMIKRGAIRLDVAKEILENIRKNPSSS